MFDNSLLPEVHSDNAQVNGFLIYVRDVDDDNEPDVEQGNPTESTILRIGFMMGMQREVLLEEKQELREESFDTVQIMMATFYRGDSEVDVAVKGSPGGYWKFAAELWQ